MVSGVIQLAIMPPLLRMPWTAASLVLSSGIALTVLGLAIMGVLTSPIFYLISGIGLFIVAILGYYGAIVEFFGFVGVKLPQGGALLK
jgi:hypothetical protein